MANDKYTNGNSQSFEDAIDKSIKSMDKLDGKIDGTNRKLGNMASNFDNVGNKMSGAFDKSNKKLIENMDKTADKLDKMAASYKNYVQNLSGKGGNIKFPTIKADTLKDIAEYSELLGNLSASIKDLKVDLSGLNVNIDAKGLNALKNIITKIDKIDTGTIAGNFKSIVNAVNGLNDIDVKVKPDSKLALNKIISLLREVRKMTSEDTGNLKDINTMLETTFAKVSKIVDKLESSKGLSTMFANQQAKSLNDNLDKQLKYKNELINKEKELGELREKDTERQKKQTLNSEIIKKNNELLFHANGVNQLERQIAGYDKRQTNIVGKRDRDISTNPANAIKINAKADYDLAVLAADKEMAIKIKESTVAMMDGAAKFKNELMELAKSGEEVPGLFEKLQNNMEALSKANSDTIKSATGTRNQKVQGAAQTYTSVTGNLPTRQDEILARRNINLDRSYENTRRRLETRRNNSEISASKNSVENGMNPLMSSILKDSSGMLLKSVNGRLASAVRHSDTLQTLLTGDKVKNLNIRKKQAGKTFDVAKANIDYEHDVTDKGLTRRENRETAGLTAQRNKGQITSEEYTTKMQANASKYEDLRSKNQEKKMAKTSKANEARLAEEAAVETELAGVTAQAVTALAGVAAALAVVVIAFEAVSEAAKKAAESESQVANAFIEMGQTNVDTSSITNIQNKLDSIKNRWDQLVINLGKGFEGIFGDVLSLVDTVILGYQKLTAYMNGTNGVSNITGSKTGKSDLTSKTIANSVANGENTEGKAGETLGNMITGANNQGFDNSSATNMSNDIYNIASKIRAKQGGDINEIAGNLNESVFKGGTQSGKYGVDTSDDTMTGYLWGKGIDAANVKMTDAMKSKYRFEALQEQYASGNSDAMQNQIKDWKELGYTIEQTKNQLFAFDKVITLQAVNPTIPTVGPNNDKPTATGGTVEDDGKTTPIIPKLDDNTYNQILEKLKALGVPVEIAILLAGAGEFVIQKIKDLEAVIEKIREAIEINITAPAIEWVAEKVKELENGIEYLKQLITVNVTAPAIAGVIAAVAGLQAGLDKLKQAIQIKFEAPNLDWITNKIEYLKNLIGQGVKNKASSIVNGIQSANNYLLESGLSAKAQELDDKYMSPEMQRMYGTGAIAAGVSIPGAAVAGTAAASAIGGGTISTIASSVEAYVSSLLGGISLQGIMQMAPAHATGGVTTKEHLAHIHRNEVITPLDNAASNPAFEKIGQAVGNIVVGAGGGGKGDTFQPIINAGIIVDNSQAINYLTDAIEAKIAQRRSRRGGSNYGMEN